MAAATAEPELGSGDGGGPAGRQPAPPSSARQKTESQPERELTGQENHQERVDQENHQERTDREKQERTDQKNPPDSGPPEHHQVLIIGGGVSGLSAASCLVKNGITDFRLLEARGRLGGRVVAITVGE